MIRSVSRLKAIPFLCMRLWVFLLLQFPSNSFFASVNELIVDALLIY